MYIRKRPETKHDNDEGLLISTIGFLSFVGFLFFLAIVLQQIFHLNFLSNFKHLQINFKKL